MEKASIRKGRPRKQRFEGANDHSNAKNRSGPTSQDPIQLRESVLRHVDVQAVGIDNDKA